LLTAVERQRLSSRGWARSCLGALHRFDQINSFCRRRVRRAV